MIYGNYIINAQQATEMMEKSLAKENIFENEFAYKQSVLELQNIQDKILQAAKEGKNEISWWIMYQTTYDVLVSQGYSLEGGRIKEAVPERLMANWGINQDKFIIRWAQEPSFSQSVITEIEERVSPILRSPGLPSSMEDVETKPEQHSSHVIENIDKIEPAIYEINYKIIGSDANLFDLNGEFKNAFVYGGLYPTSYVKGSLVDISNLRFYFTGKSLKTYKFCGWYLNENKTNKIYGGISASGNLTVYADIQEVTKKQK